MLGHVNYVSIFWLRMKCGKGILASVCSGHLLHFAQITRLISRSYVDFRRLDITLIRRTICWLNKHLRPLELFLFLVHISKLFEHFVLARSDLNSTWMLSVLFFGIVFSICLWSLVFLHGSERVFSWSRHTLTCWTQDSHQLFLHLFLLCLLLDLLRLTSIIVERGSCHGGSAISPRWLSLLLN